MKGIILAGGTGSRLFPITKSTCKQLLPVYDKPMIYYPLSILMIAQIRDVLIIVNPQDLAKFKSLFGDGSDLGMRISYRIQDEPKGLPEAFIIGEEWCKDPDGVCLILGDNLFYGNDLKEILFDAMNFEFRHGGCCIFGYHVPDPERFGVIEFETPNERNNQLFNKIINIEEKPIIPKSNYAITGLYFFDNDVSGYAKEVSESISGETQIVDLIKMYMNTNDVHLEILKRGITWTDMGTVDSLLQTSNLIASIQNMQGYQIACIEEIAFRNGWIDYNHLLELADTYKINYGNYLRRIANE